MVKVLVAANLQDIKTSGLFIDKPTGKLTKKKNLFTQRGTPQKLY